MINIIHRFTGAVLYHSETAQTIAKAVEEAARKGASLGGVKSYVNSHDIFAEIIRRQLADTFTPEEWAAIGWLIIHRPCWKTIRQDYPAPLVAHIFSILAERGWPEWAAHWAMLQQEENRKAEEKAATQRAGTEQLAVTDSIPLPGG